ncbi:MAG: NAD(P)/FAD-dependent oxidoreductase [Candidatus Thiodiazotropha sp. (ex Lucinoma aequizonata)]|nr:NAD(P)/FAD-dependent oxidoreductase [Candidatus Thiodiazotropha sp. (ex Lucinoma aequizonata)]MCU7887911.1 NAD(P)/FAD-dependent oxidoreductase [Candidatus Thiodiazotropha sp. (ex Lucinoma aequizonata)]MCU7893950.1 NAD(P)/FAD-dependent oxidoreductase [Candidatus Thiodiazotropha sp. (ex Lucinoma aequizonata)]MCU7897697.1 NAD(P)/FAD-dependent oxidoreductase [Candidatus Thiodiazotropha sp. (ex Lucinoma aequizonata)]MCU7900871.1 NAD(P)/FAD-dependent oxidoreductase [Candidatus Thiodiazotropha sp. 
MQRVTIVGSGFAALTAIKTLRSKDKSIKITVVSQKAEFHYLPGSIWIPSGIREPEDLIIDLQSFFKRMQVKHIAAKASGLSSDGRLLKTSHGDIENDGLIIASGGHFIKKLSGIEHAITPCDGIAATMKIRERLKALDTGTIAIGFVSNPKEPSAMRGGPMFEFLFGIDRQLRLEKRRENFKLVFFTPATKPGHRLGPKAVSGLLREIEKRDIGTHLGHKIVKFTQSNVVTEGGSFDADLILFMPGMTGNKWFDDTELPRSSGGLIKADAQCRIEGMNHTYVAGDSGSFPGPDWMPKQAHMADLQAVAAVNNLLAEFKGEIPKETFKVELVCIVDSQTTGMLVARTMKKNIVMPNMALFHWLKRFFEWWYLRQYR